MTESRHWVAIHIATFESGHWYLALVKALVFQWCVFDLEGPLVCSIDMQDTITTVIRVRLAARCDDSPIRKAHPRHLFITVPHHHPKSLTAFIVLHNDQPLRMPQPFHAWQTDNTRLTTVVQAQVRASSFRHDLHGISLADWWTITPK